MKQEELLQNVRAFLRFADFRDQQMPDPGEHADFRWLLQHPPDLDQLLDQCEDQYSENPYGVVWGSRKQDRSMRNMVLANPFAEIHLRLVLHPAADRLIEAQTEHALAGRIDLSESDGSGARALTTVSSSSMHGRYRNRLGRMRGAGNVLGVRTDVRRCYHEVTPNAVTKAFAVMGLRETGIHVALALEKCASDTGIAGLPVNPETSAWIANFVFRDSDNSFNRFPQVQVARWSDDIVMVGGSRSAVAACYDDLRSNLQGVGLQLSEGKTYWAPDSGMTIAELIDMRGASQGDIWASVDAMDSDLLGDLLIAELKALDASPGRLRALLGQCVKPSLAPPKNIHEIIDYMLACPSSWEQCCPRAGALMARLGDHDQRLRMVETAIDLDAEGMVASEQVVHLLRSAISGDAPFLPEAPRNLAMRLWRLANQSECVPVRGWARRVAFEFDHDWVSERVIYAGQFRDLHPFEQRWATLFADPERHNWWLQGRAEYGRWPSMAKARIESGILR